MTVPCIFIGTTKLAVQVIVENVAAKSSQVCCVHLFECGQFIRKYYALGISSVSNSNDALQYLADCR